ncbi:MULTISPECIES: hypothetical protein [Enterococcus]|nr:hypothetical protein [Enterococcus sp. HMSC072H05]DAN95139.1 MAG TPA: hypothetical protein [Caudoviricetes sp.]
MRFKNEVEELVRLIITLLIGKTLGVETAFLYYLISFTIKVAKEELVK